MDTRDTENTDASSIKPVSSLRSHFENLKSIKSPPPPPSQKPAAIPLHVGPERARSSLDIPRTASPWSSTSEIESKKPAEISTIPAQPRARHLEAGAASRQRPASMGPWSPPRTPSIVTLQSPASPPKPIFASSSQKSFDHTAAKWSNDVLSAFPLLRPRGHVQNLETPGTSAKSDGDPPKKASISGLKKPPPVNRAAKPSTPTSTSFNLDPKHNGSKERISPFSTPPSSDDSPERELNQKSTADRNLAPSNVESSRSPISAARIHQPAETQPRIAAVTSRQNSAINDLNQNSLSRPVPDFSDHPNQRPVLPTRLAADPSPARSGAQPARSQLDGQTERRPPTPQPPPRPSDATKSGRVNSEFLPPPKRNVSTSGQITKFSLPQQDHSLRGPTLARSTSDFGGVAPRNQVQTSIRNDPRGVESNTVETSVAQTSYPDTSQTNRRPPKSRCSVHQIWTQYDTRIFDICGRYTCTAGYLFRAWDTTNARMIMDVGFDERETKTTALVFKPGANAEQEGLKVWLGNNQGDIQEIDFATQSVLQTRPNAHARREIIKMYRCQNTIWSLDDDGKLHVWPPSDQGVPNLRVSPMIFRVTRGHTFSIVVKNHLWLASGRDIRIYNPMGGDDDFYVTTQALTQNGVSEVTAGALISNQLDRVYFGHADGKVTIYSATDFTCLGIFFMSAYKINCLAGAGFYLWAGYNTGTIYVYDTRSQPWKVKKDWQAHSSPVANMIVDPSSVWKLGHLQIASIGVDNAIRLWDGMLEDDWLEADMQDHDIDYCEFREIKTVVATWNAGASTPGSLRQEEKDRNFFREVIQPGDPPDILVFGFQELVDLEDKKLTAKSLFKGNKKKDGVDSDHMSRQYRAWRDYLVQVIEETMPTSEAYHLLHTASMVGLFSCIFIKASQRSRVRSLNVAEIKRGLGGLHGNKGAIMIRFILDDSSMCFTNCHLAAGQTQTVNRNNDIAAILEATELPAERDIDARKDTFIGGGDGSMIIDHEMCILNGDLNYRIDTMSRDTVIKAINTKNLSKLLERDQLLVSRRRNPWFRLRTFNEQKITFAPTYKYDVGTDRYDTSEKSRSPAWCDRLLYRGVGRIKQIDYRRHDLRLSDHRPVSGTFLMRVKSIDQQRKAVVWEECERRLVEMKQKVAQDARLDYLVNVLGVDSTEAKRLMAK